MNDTMLTTIKGYWLANRCSPTVRELRDLCGLSSISLVLVHLRELEAEGRILPRTRNHKRNIIPSNMVVVFP